MRKSWLKIALFTICGVAICYFAIVKPQALPLPRAISPDQHKRLFLATGSPGGTYYSLGNAMAQLWNEALAEKVDVITQSSGASVENIRMLESGEAQLILAMNDTADDAWQGRGEFNKGMNHFRSIGTIYPEVLQIVTLETSNIAEFSEITGKKVTIGPNGSGSAVFAKEMLDLANFSKQDLELYNIVFEDGISSMKQGRMDVSIVLFTLPSAAIDELSRERPIKLLDLSDGLIAKLQEKHPLVSRFTIPAGTYGSDRPVNTVSIKAVLFCKDDLSAELVYDLTKTLYERNSKLAGSHMAGRYVDIKTALDGITVPLHQGAARYYKEKGLNIAKEIDSVETTP